MSVCRVIRLLKTQDCPEGTDSRFILQTRERVVENFEEEVGVLLVDAHWRRETNCLSPEPAFAEKESHFFRGLHYLRTFFPGRLFRLSIFHQLDPEK